MTSVDWRRIVREELEMLSSEEKQFEYERMVPRVDITKELVSGWFDDSYHPSDASFVETFQLEELKLLAQFNELYKRRLAQLPPSHGTVRSWLVAPEWREVMNGAASTLHGLARGTGRSATRTPIGLTSPSSGQPTASFAACGPPLTSNVRPQKNADLSHVQTQAVRAPRASITYLRCPNGCRSHRRSDVLRSR